jgi:hypothetical protein
MDPIFVATTMSAAKNTTRPTSFQVPKGIAADHTTRERLPDVPPNPEGPAPALSVMFDARTKNAKKVRPS